MDKSKNKSLLCKNIIENGKCSYGKKCMYAHSKQEQELTEKRKMAFDIIQNKIDLKEIDLDKNVPLYNELIILTRVCEKCEENKCYGGLNCKFGSPSKDFVICADDLIFNNCSKENCTEIHLTDFGLKISEIVENTFNFIGNFIGHRNNMSSSSMSDDTDNIISYLSNDSSCDDGFVLRL